MRIISKVVLQKAACVHNFILECHVAVNAKNNQIEFFLFWET